MQAKYNTKIGLGKALLVGGLVGVMGTVSGCGSTGEKIRVSQKNSDMRYLQNIANKYGKLSLCDASGWEEYPRIQAYIDKTCEEGIIEHDRIPKENFHKQGREMWILKLIPMTNLYYDGEVLYFNKKENRYAVKLNSLTAYKLNGVEFKFDGFMTKHVRGGQEVFKAVDHLKTQTTNQNNQNNEIMEGVKERVGAAAAFEGLMRLGGGR